MSATLGALVIAIATQSSVLLSAPLPRGAGSGRDRGRGPASRYTRTGAAVAASGVTAIAGFAVLALASPIQAVLGGNAVRMLTDFGLVTVFDLAVALAGVMLVLPAALVWAEGGLARLAGAVARPAARADGFRCRLRTIQRDRSRDRSRPQNPGRRYSTFVGLAFLVLITIATLNTIRTEGGGILGTSKSDRGFPLPEFAVPDARTDAGGDANVYQDDCATSQNPCPADQQRHAACEIDVPNAIRVCDLFDRPLAISFLFLKGSNCVGRRTPSTELPGATVAA